MSSLMTADTTGLLQHMVTVFMGFFAIMNPIANVPVFLGLTGDDDARTTKLVAARAVITAFLIVAVFAICGKLLFDVFGLTIPALRITGGILVFMIGFQMLQGQQSSVHQLGKEGDKKSLEAELSIAITPLAIPILAGPGTLVTAMNFSTGGGLTEVSITLLCFGSLCLLTYLLFVSGERFVRFIGEGALGVITRLMGLILAGIGMQMMIDGLKGAFPSL